MKKYVTLGEVCTKGSSNIAQKDIEQNNGSYGIYGASGYIKDVDFYHQDKPYIAVVKDGAGIGRTMLLPEKTSIIGTMQYLIPKDDVCVEYLYYAVTYMNLAKYFSGATIPHIYFKDYQKEKLPLLTIEEQRKIADNLRQIDRLIELCSGILQKLDVLVKSRFVEMFGDPQTNSKNLPTAKLIDVVKMQRGFDLPVNSRNQAGSVPVYGSNGVLGNHDTAKAFNGGVITGRSGTIGKVYYTKEDYWPLNTSLFSVDTHGNNVIYLAFLLQLFDLTRFTEGTGVPTLNRNKFHNEQIIKVEQEEQNQFAAFVEQTDKSKFIAINIKKIIRRVRFNDQF